MSSMCVQLLTPFELLVFMYLDRWHNSITSETSTISKEMTCGEGGGDFCFFSISLQTDHNK